MRHTAERNVVTALQLVLRPKETVVPSRPGQAHIASEATCADDGGLTTILLREVRRLEQGVRRRRGKLLELELVHVGGDKGQQEQQGGESVEIHGGGWREEGRRVRDPRRLPL